MFNSQLLDTDFFFKSKILAILARRQNRIRTQTQVEIKKKSKCINKHLIVVVTDCTLNPKAFNQYTNRGQCQFQQVPMSLLCPYYKHAVVFVFSYLSYMPGRVGFLEVQTLMLVNDEILIVIFNC